MAYSVAIVVLLVMAHISKPRALRLTPAIGILSAAALAPSGLLTTPVDDIARLAARALATSPALLGLGSLLRIRARARGLAGRPRRSGG